MGGAADHAWNVAAYERFSDLRLRPALDLLARTVAAPAGDIVDLGCGSGAAAPALAARFPARRIVGVDASRDMLGAARAGGVYADLADADIAEWRPAAPPAAIFSNAALHWLDDHAALIPRLLSLIAPGGSLAVQMPGQLDRPSHATMIAAAAAAVRPDLFANFAPFPGPAALADYAAMAQGVDAWETSYLQHLTADAEGAHPVRRFVSSTGARPILSRLNEGETADFAARWDAALDRAYPREADGGVWFPFRRLFFVAPAPAAA